MYIFCVTQGINEFARLLRKHPLFARLSPRTLRQMAAHATLTRAHKGGMIYREGDRCDALYVVISGRCQAHVHRPDGGEHVLAVYGPGDMFGDWALLSADRHWTSVRVVSDADLLRIRAEDVQRVLDHHPALARQMAQHMTRQLRYLRDGKEREGEQPPSGKVVGLSGIARDPLCWIVAENLAAALKLTAAASVLLLDIRTGCERPLLADWQGIPNGAIERGNDGVHRLRLYITGAPAETPRVATAVSDLARPYRYVLAFTSADVPAPIAVAFLLQADASYVLLRQTADDLHRASLLIREIHARPGGQMTQVMPVVCLDRDEQANPHSTLAGQLGLEVHRFLKDVPRGEREPDLRVVRAPKDRFSVHVFQLAREISRRRVGLALSAGGAKGLAHIGAIQVLEENDLHADVIAGSSMGACVGALWAAGLNGRQIEEIAMRLARPFGVFRMIDFAFAPRRGFMKGGRIRRLLLDTIGPTHFADMVRQLRVVATDVDTLDRHVFEHGEVARAVQASMAMPGVVTPVEVDGLTLIDGGVCDPLPVDVLIEMGLDSIIAVNTIPSPDDLRACQVGLEPVQPRGPLGRARAALDSYLNYFSRGNILDILVRSLHAAETRVAESACRQADLVLKAISCDGKWHDFKNPSKYIRLGREAAERHLPELLALVGRSS